MIFLNWYFVLVIFLTYYIDSTSYYRLQPSSVYHNKKDLVNVSNHNWTYWLYLLDMFIKVSETLKQVTVIVPLLINHNIFLTSRINFFQWRRIDFKDLIMVHHCNWLRNLQKTSAIHISYVLFDVLVGFQEIIHKIVPRHPLLKAIFVSIFTDT